MSHFSSKKVSIPDLMGKVSKETSKVKTRMPECSMIVRKTTIRLTDKLKRAKMEATIRFKFQDKNFCTSNQVRTQNRMMMNLSIGRV